MSTFKIETLEISGFVSVISAIHLPYGKDPYFTPEFDICKDSRYDPIFQGDVLVVSTKSTTNITAKQLLRLSNLVKSGDEHAKVIRGITVGVAITAPIWFYRELETYRVGRERLSSESTMHIDCKGLSGEVLEATKDKIPMGHIQRTVDTISYQTLRRIYFQRRNHRLPMWHKFCDWIKTLPFAELLITIE